MKRMLLILALAWTIPALAVEPDEMLADPALEARAREISKGLRCPVCRNESIDESNAGIAGDLRLMVRERLLEGDSDAEVVAYIVARYGEFVLLRPTASGSTLILWIAAPGLLAGGLGIAVFSLRRRGREGQPVANLDPDEANRLAEVMKD